MTTDNPASNNEHSESFDVVVIGGGPAGSSVSAWLAQWGRTVLLLEKETFPRHHVGESLLPGTIGLLLRLGVLADVEEAGFVPKYGATYIWGSSREPWTISFSEAGREIISSYQVVRSEFDQLLLEHSRASGVAVREGCRVIDVQPSSEQPTHVTYIDAAESQMTATCRFCVDASGNTAFLGTRTRSREFNPNLRNIALYGYFRDGRPVTDLVEDLDSRDAGNIFIVAVDRGWLWYIPLGNALYSVGLVTDASLASAINTVGRSTYLLQAVKGCPELCFLTENAKLDPDTVRTQSDWSYICSQFYGPGYLLVGDAACFVDPILSTGVSLAIEGAFKAALALNTSLEFPKLESRALRWYDEEYRATAMNYTQLAEHWYHGHRNRDDWFWKARKLTDPASNASIRQAFALVAGGYAGNPTDKRSAELVPFGGFGPFQLQAIYSALEREQNLIDPDLDRSADDQPSDDRKRRKVDHEKLLHGTPQLVPEYGFKPSMTARGNRLEPVTQITERLSGNDIYRDTLSNAYLPVLHCIDGRLRMQEVVTCVIESTGEEYPGDPQDLRNLITTILHDLYRRGIINIR